MAIVAISQCGTRGRFGGASKAQDSAQRERERERESNGINDIASSSLATAAETAIANDNYSEYLHVTQLLCSTGGRHVCD